MCEFLSKFLFNLSIFQKLISLYFLKENEKIQKFQKTFLLKKNGDYSRYAFADQYRSRKKHSLNCVMAICLTTDDP